MGVSSPSGLMSIGSIIEPPVHHSYPQTSWNDYQMQPLGSRHLTPDYPYTSSSTEPPHSLYSSDGGYSPASDSYNAPAQTSYMPLHDRIATSYASEYPIPPVPMPASGPWTHQPGEYPQSIEGLGIEFSDQCPPPVGISRDVRTMNHCILTGTPGQTTSTSSLNVGPGFELRAKHSLANELVSGNLVDLDGESLRHYDNCFWDYVDPLFPIIHRPTYMAATCGFLSATVFALGAQFSPRPQARAHSLSWFMIASEHCAAVSYHKSDAERARLTGNIG